MQVLHRMCKKIMGHFAILAAIESKRKEDENMTLSLKRARLYREIALDSKKRPVANGEKVAFVREQVIDSSGRVVRSSIRRAKIAPKRG